MTVRFDTTPLEAWQIRRIAERATGLVPSLSLMHLMMDLTAAHKNGCPLDLNALAEADDFNALHDVLGIHRHINRDTGAIEDFFIPRFAVKQGDTA